MTLSGPTYVSAPLLRADTQVRPYGEARSVTAGSRRAARRAGR